MTFGRLCRDLFLLANTRLGENSVPPRGFRWEQRIAEYLGRAGTWAEALPGGYSVLGHISMSGLAHQVDAVLECPDAFVIGEWKANAGVMAKNEMVRFKAVTDDYFMSLGHAGRKRPIMRVYCGTGTASDSLRAYAALHGIVLIEPLRWPAPVLAADSSMIWRNDSLLGPSTNDQRRLAWLSRSLQSTLVPQPGGGFLVPPPLSASAINAVLRLQDYWSDRLWEAVELWPGWHGLLESVMGRFPRLR
jgi:hypothetical protein